MPESAELTGQRRNLIEATYDIRIEGHDDFFEAYVAALERGYLDLLAGSPELIQIVDEVYEEAIGYTNNISVGEISSADTNRLVNRQR